MSRTTIDRLIINSPYAEPTRHWRYERETRLFDLVEGRRPAGYVVASESSKALVIAPGLTVKSRLAVLIPSTPGNYYDAFCIVPSALTCYDFSATPFSPSGKQTTEKALFGWIVSDFGLNDAIELAQCAASV